MIEVVKNIDTSAILRWLEKDIRPHLTPDVSRYARGRLRGWLWIEPTLTSPTQLLPGITTPLLFRHRLQEIINWSFDYCLVTYSGDETATGITAHRDASYADYEAYGLNVSGECVFQYWCGRESFGYARDIHEFTSKDLPTHHLHLKPGDLVRFNCKNLHAAQPTPRRWNMNFWKGKKS